MLPRTRTQRVRDISRREAFQAADTARTGAAKFSCVSVLFRSRSGTITLRPLHSEECYQQFAAVPNKKQRILERSGTVTENDEKLASARENRRFENDKEWISWRFNFLSSASACTGKIWKCGLLLDVKGSPRDSRRSISVLSRTHYAVK